MIEVRSEDLAVCLGHLDLDIKHGRTHLSLVAPRPGADVSKGYLGSDWVPGPDEFADCLDLTPTRFSVPGDQFLVWTTDRPELLARVSRFVPSAVYLLDAERKRRQQVDFLAELRRVVAILREARLAEE
jgi:hypothetical protein